MADRVATGGGDSKMKVFCTCGRGTEVFAAVEVVAAFKDCLSEVSITDGKIFCEFTKQPRNLSDIFKLKMCERIFVEILHCSDVNVFNKKQGTKSIKSYIDDICTWAEAVEMLEILKQVETKILGGGGEEIVVKRSCAKALTFRVSAKCSGRPAKYLDQKWLSCTIGHKVSAVTSLRVDFKDPDLEIFCHLNNDGLVIGIPCCREPLSKRVYVKHNGLRSTVAAVLAFLCAAKPGMTLLDPTCGRGILLMETALMYKNTMLIGCDISSSIIAEAKENISHFNSMGPASIQLLQSDAQFAPLRSSSIDVVLCDIPFGIKHNLMKDMKMFLKSIDRLLVKGGKCIILSGLQTTKQLLLDVKLLFACDGSLCGMTTNSSEESTLSKLLHQIIACHELNNFDNEMLEVITSSIDVTCYTEKFLQKEFNSNKLEQCQLSPAGYADRSAEKEISSNDCPGSAWMQELVHYLKLGETDSFVSVFKKIL